MIGRKVTMIVVVSLAWSLAVAGFGVANMPSGVLPYALAHSPGSLLLLGEIWVVIPAAFALWLLGPVASWRPIASFLRRFFKPRRPKPPDRVRWSERILIIFSPVILAVQTFQTVGLVLYWRRREIPAVAAAVRNGPHYFGFPDPHHWLLRATCISGLFLIAWFGNGLPKLMNPFRGVAEPYDWSRMMRDCGRIITLGALADAACLVLLPFPLGFVVGIAIISASFLVAGVVWAAYRFGGRPGRLTPPGQTP